VRAYIVALRALLRGEPVEWDGALIKMLHLDGFAAPRPLDVPLIVGAAGPKGLAVAAELADGVFVAGGTSGPRRRLAHRTSGRRGRTTVRMRPPRRSASSPVAGAGSGIPSSASAVSRRIPAPCPPGNSDGGGPLASSRHRTGH
jgi:alkanesulfonate monooxygenase SsuD/methylene tetrahydromethanopterin reductase-like flavin-dependent oxidoreductase (luciferase family)